MRRIDENARYAETHEWARKEGALVVVGLSDFAQDSLGDIVFVETPRPGAVFRAKAVFGVVESVKAASDLYIPVSGKIAAVNEQLAAAPELVNKDPYGEGWIIRVEPEDPAEFEALLSPEDYGKLAAD
jgi:glycine cleavage system H protein